MVRHWFEDTSAASALLDGAADIFERGSETAPSVDEDTVRSLHVKIGELAVANDAP